MYSILHWCSILICTQWDSVAVCRSGGFAVRNLLVTMCFRVTVSVPLSVTTYSPFGSSPNIAACYAPEPISISFMSSFMNRTRFCFIPQWNEWFRLQSDDVLCVRNARPYPQQYDQLTDWCGALYKYLEGRDYQSIKSIIFASTVWIKQ